ncbi:MAG: hypothetical protein RL662_470 [Bacteroidota bacterium]|jgi:PKD repeat protein
MKKLFFIVCTLLFLGCHTEQTIPVEIAVVLHTKDDHTSPIVVTIENKTRNAEEFLWTFEGGEPATSSLKNPGSVTFTTPGNHKITLQASNAGDQASKEYTVHVDSVVVAQFDVQVDVNNYAPARYVINNQSVGGMSYQWLFEGGEPASFQGSQPPQVVYPREGKYTIVLVVDNGTALFTKSKDIEVRAALGATFNTIPSFEDIDDMEAPLRATFSTQLSGVEHLMWECQGATITNPTDANASIYFASAGIYTVYLNVWNGKESKKVSQVITVKANTNLRTHKDVKLGINTAQESIGAFYSTKLRQVIKTSMLSQANGELIDIAFLGMNAEFTYNRFVSPNKLSATPLSDIPSAKPSIFVNNLTTENIAFSSEQFEAMTTDADLKNRLLGVGSSDDVYFTGSILPHIVLFETADARKGAIRVNKIVKGGKENSYIVVDIKIQKND